MEVEFFEFTLFIFLLSFLLCRFTSFSKFAKISVIISSGFFQLHTFSSLLWFQWDKCSIFCCWLLASLKLFAFLQSVCFLFRLDDFYLYISVFTDILSSVFSVLLLGPSFEFVLKVSFIIFFHFILRYVFCFFAETFIFIFMFVPEVNAAACWAISLRAAFKILDRWFQDLCHISDSICWLSLFKWVEVLDGKSFWIVFWIFWVLCIRVWFLFKDSVLGGSPLILAYMT